MTKYFINQNEEIEPVLDEDNAILQYKIHPIDRSIYSASELQTLETHKVWKISSDITIDEDYDPQFWNKERICELFTPSCEIIQSEHKSDDENNESEEHMIVDHVDGTLSLTQSKYNYSSYTIEEDTKRKGHQFKEPTPYDTFCLAESYEDEPPMFQCVECPMKFESAVACHIHLENVHILVRVCKVCNEVDSRFRNIKFLIQHLKNNHDLLFLEAFDANIQGYGDLWYFVKEHQNFMRNAVYFNAELHSYAKRLDEQSDQAMQISIVRKKWASLERPKVVSRKKKKKRIQRKRTQKSQNSRASIPSVSNTTRNLPDKASAFRKNAKEQNNKTHKSKDPKKWCFVCRTRITYSDFDEHFKTHRNELKFRCDQPNCSKGFLTQSSLDLHKRSHTNERIHKCTICSRAYNYSSLLTRHMRIHSGEKPYQCQDCNQRFHDLVSHNYHIMKVHTGERPHICQYCNRGFILASDLKKHLLGHERTKLGDVPLIQSDTGNIVTKEGPSRVINTRASSRRLQRNGKDVLHGNSSNGWKTRSTSRGYYN